MYKEAKDIVQAHIHSRFLLITARERIRDKVSRMSFKEMNNYNRDGSSAWFCLCKLTFLIGEKLSNVDLEVNYQLAEG